MSGLTPVATSTLGYALLGLIGRGASTGYELSLLLKEPVGFYWHARHSQIYPELAKLRKAGLVRPRPVRQSDRPDKKIYALTLKGRSALKEWVTEPPREHRSRDELLLKTFSLWIADRKAARALYESELTRHRATLRRHQRVARAYNARVVASTRGSATKAFTDYATLRRGIGYEREVVAWLRWMLQHLRVTR